jgi:hypothetical protein
LFACKQAPTGAAPPELAPPELAPPELASPELASLGALGREVSQRAGMLVRP